MHWTAFAAAVYGLVGYVVALDAIEAYGNKFFKKDGSQFFIKGVAYQLRPHDPLIDTDQCQRDASLMKELGANTIRVYHVDANAKHDGCMKAFADAGIYVLLDLDTFTTYIVPEVLYWNGSQYDKYVEVMDAFHGYNNVLGFYVGNENIAKRDHSIAAPYIKAAARDIKAYRDRKGYRQIPVGYSAADIQELRPQLQDYLTCGGNSSDNIDFFSLNSYSWCDPSDFNKSTYNMLQEYAKAFPVPIFFSETGCIVPGPRTWEDQDAIFSKPMVNDWSGAIIYEWIQEMNAYGIVTYGPPAGDGASGEDIEDGFTRKGKPTPKSPDFDNLKTRWANIHPTGISKGDYDRNSVSTRACPTSTSGGWWQVNGNVQLPTLGQIMDGATFTSMPVATEDPSTTSNKTESTPTIDSGNRDGGTDDNKNSGRSIASRDSSFVVFGMSLASIVLITALVL